MLQFIEPITEMESFKIFQPPHLVVLALLALVCGLLIVFRKAIASNPKLEKTVRHGIVAVLVCNQIAYYSWEFYAGQFTFAECLPLNLCTVAVYVCMYLLVTQDERIFGTLYFIGIGGATQALITPSMNGYNFPHFRFFEFFVAHAFIIITVCYGLAVLRYRINFKECIKAFLFVQVLSVVAMVTNFATGGNYMFLAHKPDSASIMSLLADWPYYIFQLEVIVLVVFALLAVPFIISDKKAFFITKTHAKR